MIIDTNLTVTSITPDVVKYVVDKIVKVVRPSRIVLFGSQARGTNRSESDLDLLVITRTGDDREKVRLEIERTLRGRRFGIDLLVRTPEEVEWNIEAENPFYTDEIFGKGQIMYEH
jgi:predicted nucleotidyltransferase